MTRDVDFLPTAEYFESLVQDLPQPDLDLYNSYRHVRIEKGYRNRSFFIYKMDGRRPQVLDEVVVLDFVCNDSVGATSELRSKRSGKVIELGYAPIRLLGFPVFVSIPLHMQVRWDVRSTKEKMLAATPVGSLCFPILIRTKSRLHPREQGVVYMETGFAFTKEFGQDAVN